MEPFLTINRLIKKRKEDDYWVKKCIEYEVEGPRPRGRPKRTWREVVKDERTVKHVN